MFHVKLTRCRSLGSACCAASNSRRRWPPEPPTIVTVCPPEPRPDLTGRSMTIILLALVALLAFANGANDNCKGVATLVGFGAATPRRAMIYATATTLVGAIISLWFSGGLIKTFSTGLFAAGTSLGAG